MKQQRTLRIGIISLWWLPVTGGVEIYGSRLAKGLSIRGINVSVFTGSSKESATIDKDSDLSVFRFGDVAPPGDFSNVPSFIFGPKYRSWCKAALSWAKKEDCSHVLINRPLVADECTKHMISNLQSYGMRVGLIHYDMDVEIQNSLMRSYQVLHDWQAAAERLLSAAKTAALDISDESPLRLEGDFTLMITDWMAKLTSRLVPKPLFVLHPLLQSFVSPRSAPLHRVTVSMVNPRPQKGALIMASVIDQAPPDWSFRILSGGWGDARKTFSPLIEDAACMPGRIDFIDHIEQIELLFLSSDTFVFPSRREGYGLCAVEALQSRIPVLATALPSISEGVGEGAFVLPFHADARSWLEAIKLVISEKHHWKDKAQQRVTFLLARQETEVQQLCEFLQGE